MWAVVPFPVLKCRRSRRGCRDRDLQIIQAGRKQEPRSLAALGMTFREAGLRADRSVENAAPPKIRILTKLLREHDIVDEPCCPYQCGHYDESSWENIFNWIEAVGIHDLQIIQAHLRL